MSIRDLDAERDKIQREIEALERSLVSDISSIEVIVSGSSDGSDDGDYDSGDELDEDLEDDEMVLEDGSHRVEMCLQMNLVYQAVIQEKLQELELLISQNKVQQEELLWELAGRKSQRVGTRKLYPSNLAIGHFFKPYFKDKTTGVGPPANPEMIERSCHIVKTFKELSSRKWRTADNEELKTSVLSDTLQRMLQPKLLKVEYLQQKRDNAKSDIDKKILTKQIEEVEREIDDINQLPEETLFGQRTDGHDWEKISNVNFEGVHNANRISKVWKNHLHPHINKETWEEDEIKKLQEIAEEHNFVNWELIAEDLGTKRTAFQCLQQFQLNNKDCKRKEFTKEEDEVLIQLVQRMRVGMHIPYSKIAYFMEGRDAMQLLHRWSKCLDPSIKKGSWTKEEDELLLKAVKKYGEKDWYKIRFEVPGRSDVQCRERYLKGLHKDIKKGKWSQEEELKLIELTKKYGVGHWSKVGKEITHRTGSQCLSKWKCISGVIKRRQIRKRPENTAPQKKPRKTEPQKRPQKRQQNRASKKIKVEELSEGESDISSESSCSFVTSSSSTSSSSSSTSSSSSSSEDEDDTVNTSDDSDMEKRRAATKFLESLPCLDLWIPRKQSSDLSSENAIHNSRVPRTKMRGRRGSFQFNTILKGIAYPPSTDTVTENPEDILLKAKNSGHRILQISEDEVRRILRWNTILCRGKWSQRVRKTQAKPAGDTTEKSAPRLTQWMKRPPVDRSLLVAVTPWVGNVFLPILTRYKSPWDKQIHADVMRKKLSSVTVASTPIFTLLIQLFQINAGGCLQMIRLRKAQESKFLQTVKQTARRTNQADAVSPKSVLAHSLNAQQSPPTGSEERSDCKSTPQTRRRASRCQVRSSVPAPKTVFELLKEKRMQQSKARRSAQNKIVVSPRIVVSSQILVGQATIPVGQQQTPVLPVASPTMQNSLLQQTMPFVQLPTCQVLPTNHIVNNQISASSESVHRQGADNAVAVAENAEATNKCNSTPSIGSPCAVQAMPSFQGMATQQIPIQLLQGAVSPAANSTTWILTPHGLVQIPVQIPVQALFPNPVQAPTNQNSFVSESSFTKAVDPSTNGASFNKVPEMPTSVSSTVSQQLPVSNGLSSSESTAGEASQLQCAKLLPTFSTPSRAWQFTPTPKKYPVVKVAKILPPNQSKAGTSNAANSQTPAPSQTTTQISTSSTEKNILDLSLVSLEDETTVKDWLQSKSRGETLKSSMSYLPPSACTLKTFSRLLLQKKTLEESAFKLLPLSDRGGKGDIKRKQEILDNLVEQKLKDNPAYNLLKQRFFSAFTVTGLLAVFTPPNMNAKSVVKSEVKDEDKAIDMDMYGSYADNNTNGGPTTQSQPNEGETLNPDSRCAPMNVEGENDAENTGRRLRRRMVYCRSET